MEVKRGLGTGALASSESRGTDRALGSCRGYGAALGSGSRAALGSGSGDEPALSGGYAGAAPIGP
jgi:hypothetical protein